MQAINSKSFLNTNLVLAGVGLVGLTAVALSVLGAKGILPFSPAACWATLGAGGALLLITSLASSASNFILLNKYDIEQQVQIEKENRQYCKFTRSRVEAYIYQNSLDWEKDKAIADSILNAICLENLSVDMHFLIEDLSTHLSECKSLYTTMISSLQSLTDEDILQAKKDHPKEVLKQLTPMIHFCDFKKEWIALLETREKLEALD